MRTSFPGRPKPARTLASTLLLCLLLTVTGCSDGGLSTPGAGTSTAREGVVESAQTTLPTNAAIGQIVGRLPGTRRKHVRKQVTAVIDQWWEAAYLAGDRPGADVSQAFPAFTDGARKRARFDRDLMTNADLDVETITPLMRKVRLDLLAVNQHARSVTARFDLRVRTRGTRNGRLRMHGRLFLTKRSGAWQVFGYDVSKGWL